MKKKFISILAASMMIAPTVGAITISADSGSKNTEMRDITTMELVRDMGIGINLGNTMEACGDWIASWKDTKEVSDFETAWGSPVITEDMIRGMAEEGFGVLRVPVAWSNMMGDNYTINSELDARVHEIVDWALDSDMYVIVNIHWDNGWVNTFPDNKEECMTRYTRMWEQISDSFKDYGDHLIFESQNEELGWDSMWNQWGGPSDKEGSFALVNEINQKFVDIIRSSGGNNPKRHLLISGYNTSIDLTCDPLFKMPNDPANRCAVSVHYYTPAGFAILEDDADWAKARSTWGTDADFAELNQQMDMMKTNYIDKGIPVIIGEYGCPTKNKEADSVRLFISSVCKAAYDRQMCPVLWSTPDGNDSLGHYDRKACQLHDRELQALLSAIPDKKPNPTEPTEPPTTEPDETVYDVNGDGKFNIADAVMLQRWLLKNGTLTNPKAADVNGDGAINAFDLVFLRRALIENAVSQYNGYSVLTSEWVRGNHDYEASKSRIYLADTKAYLYDIIGMEEVCTKDGCTCEYTDIENIYPEEIEDDFFENNMAIVIYSSLGAGNKIISADKIVKEQDKLLVYTTTKHPIPTPDMAYCRTIIAIDRSIYEGVSKVTQINADIYI